MMERRRCRRLAPPQPLKVRLKSRAAAVVVDLTPYGTLLETAIPLAPRTEINLAIPLDDGELKLNGIVRRCRLDRGRHEHGLVFFAGMEFVHLDRSSRESLEDMMVDICLTEIEAERESAEPCYKEWS